jgi:exoribonuclease-2
LGLSEVSPALSFGLDVEPRGKIVGAEITPSWVRVERLTYAAAEERLTEEPFYTLLHLAYQGQDRRRDHGAFFITLPEVKIRVKDGQVVIRSLPPLQSRDLVMEAMLMAGEMVARFALEHDIPLPFTTQAPPDEVEVFPEGLAGMFAQRRTLKPRQLKSVHGPHAGLGLEVYAQATSPLRRYLDLVVHQQLRAYLRGEKMLDAGGVLERVGAAEAVSGNVRQTEQLANRHWILVYLMAHPEWRGEGILVDKRGRRGIVIIPEFALEVSLHLDADVPLNTSLTLVLSGLNLPRLEAHFKIEA